RRGSSSEQDAVPPYSFDNPNARQTSMMAMESYRREQQALLQQQQTPPQLPAPAGATAGGVANNLAMVAASSAATAVATATAPGGGSPPEGGAQAAAAEDDQTIASNQKGLPIQMMITPGGESGSDYSPNKLPHSVLAKSISPPPLRHRTLMHQRSGPATLQSSSRPTKFQTPRYPEEQALRQVKPLLSRSTSAAQPATTSGCPDGHHTRDSSLGR
ncbi:GL25503, partial [Drosophila persimilis]